MKIRFCLILLAALFTFGCAHNPALVSDSVGNIPGNTPEMKTGDDTPSARNLKQVLPEAVSSVAVQVLPGENPGAVSSYTGKGLTTTARQSLDTDLAGDYVERDAVKPGEFSQGEPEGMQKGNASEPIIADPLEPFNRAMFQFNDKLYFWVLKPVSQGYKWLVHEDLRVLIGNFFTNAAFPVRFINCLLQANLPGAAGELGRFLLNTVVGFGGFFDPASDKEINLAKHNEDFGQTLGVYGIGNGFYIHWPIFGPSSPRDTVGKVGDGFLNPFSYLDEWYETAGVKAYEMVNDTSFSIGDYEALKKAAIDPYVAVRNAYVQHRAGSIKKKEGFYSSIKAGQ